ncbi:MAG: MarR family transcriptional regulator [Anaerolineaceae bacterium]|nr:MarR family transcriptional regulator [Anaerolineaceae bacterium]
MDELDRDILAFWGLLFEIVADFEKRLAAHMAAHDLTPPQFYVLKTLMERGGRCRIGEIAREHHLTNATMTGLVKRLEALSPPLVQRDQSSDDKRAVDVSLTPAGQQRFWDIQNSLMTQVRALFELVPAQERKESLAKVREYFDLLTNLFPMESNGKTPIDM